MRLSDEGAICRLDYRVLMNHSYKDKLAFVVLASSLRPLVLLSEIPDLDPNFNGKFYV